MHNDVVKAEIFYVSGEGFGRCPTCARHVELEDEVALTQCAFCGTAILERPVSHPTAIQQIAQLGGVSGRIATELRRLSGRPPDAANEQRDSNLVGDPASLVRTRTEDDSKRPHPIHVVWELTLKCDLGCRHCGSRAGKARSNELSTAECFALVDQLADVGVREITLIGGEAYLREDWTDVARRIVRRGMVCTMTTGARNLTQERVRAAADAGIGSIAISIDGLEMTHDAQRGVRGSWRSAVDAAGCIVACGMRVSTNTQINALSAPELPGIARLMGQIESAAWQIQLTVPMGRAADRPGLLLQPHELLQVFPLLVWTKEYILAPLGIALIPGNNIGYFGPFEQYLRYGGSVGAHWTACAAGQWTLGIEADGGIKGCPSLPSSEYLGGNVRDRPLKDIVERQPRLTQLQRRTRQDLWGYCRDCYYADVCLGGCTWTSHCLLGRPGNNPYCIHRATELAAAGRAERIASVESAPGRPFDVARFDLVEEAFNDDGDVASVLGIRLAQVIAAGPECQSLWDAATLKRRLESQATPRWKAPKFSLGAEMNGAQGPPK